MRQIEYGLNEEVNPAIYPNLHRFLTTFQEYTEMMRDKKRNRDDFGDC